MARQSQTGEPLAEVHPSGGRRYFALIALAGLGGLLILIGAQGGGGSGAIGARIGFLLFGGASLWAAMVLWRSTSVGLVLTEDGLFDTNGRVLAEMDHIDRVDRGMFAFKPSNGFLVILNTAGARTWQPGLWWRLGRRIGVGGVCNGAETRAMADILSMRLAQRDGPR